MGNGVTQIRRSVMVLALPVTVTTLLQRAEGIVAVFLVGGLGATSIAAVGLGQLLAFVAATLQSRFFSRASAGNPTAAIEDRAMRPT